MKKLEKLPFFEEGFSSIILPLGKISYKITQNEIISMPSTLYYLFDNKIYGIEYDGDIDKERDDVITNYYEFNIDDIGYNSFLEENDNPEIDIVYFLMDQPEPFTSKVFEHNDGKTMLDFENDKWRGICLSEDGVWDFTLWYSLREGSVDYEEFQYECTLEKFKERIENFIK